MISVSDVAWLSNYPLNQLWAFSVASGNTSSNPLAPASPVDDPEIAEICDLRSGEILNAKEFIASHRYDAFIKLRGEIREQLKTENPMFACAWCSTPAYVVSKEDGKRFFFRHTKEDGSCPAHTRGALSQDEIRARKYHGQRESAAHKRIKNLIERSLSADPSFHTIQQEKIWRAARDPKSRRQPDVQARSSSLGRIAFEVQLSTTFLNVVVERRAFYRQEGALLVWVLGQIPQDYRRLMIDDLLFSNNSNIFIVDDETARISEEQKAFHVRCFFRTPVRDTAEVVDQWEEKIVAFSELTCSVAEQTAFFFDYAGEEKRLRTVIATEAAAARAKAEDALREEFFALCRAAAQFHVSENSELHARWDALVSTLAARGIKIPYRDPDGDSGFRALIFGVLSAQVGVPVGWKFDKLLQVAHCIFDRHKEHLFAFGCAIQHYGREAMLKEQDRTGTWSQRKAAIKEALRCHDPDLEPDSRWLPALLFLFPEIGRRVKTRVDLIEQEFIEF